MATDERVLVATRSHISSLLPALWLSLLAVGISSFASTISADSALLGWAGCALAVLVAWKVLQGVSHWIRTTFWVTNYRVVIQQGFHEGSGVSLPLMQVEGVELKPIMTGMGHSAHLHLRSQGEIFVLRYVPRGHDFSHEIRQAQDRISSYYSWSWNL